MGINGLLPLLKSIEQRVHIKEYAGRRVAVDGNVWLHKGAFSCARELALGQETNLYVDYFIRQVKMLLHFNVQPVIVFDGAPLPLKKGTAKARQGQRQEARHAGYASIRAGKPQQDSDGWFRRATHVTPDMIAKVKKALEALNVKYIQAPYEADSQMTYLCQHDKVAAVITEDSDLLVFGCPQVLLKMDQFGEATLINQADLFKIKDNTMDFTKWDATRFRHMCILSGCDYLPSLQGVGLHYAYNQLRNQSNIEKVMKVLHARGKMRQRLDYPEQFYRANLAFLHQQVYDPDLKQIVRMTPADETVDLSFLEADDKNDTLPASPTSRTATPPSSSAPTALSDSSPRKHPVLKHQNALPHTHDRLDENVVHPNKKEDKGKKRVDLSSSSNGPLTTPLAPKTNTQQHQSRPRDVRKPALASANVLVAYDLNRPMPTADEKQLMRTQSRKRTYNSLLAVLEKENIPPWLMLPEKRLRRA
ncbi:PIN domain-like protein [Gongronella butleri]|nr:PIN domain-like protein [Gongronella butleri]